MLKKILLVAAAAAGGIYLTSEEGKQARSALAQKKNAFEPIVKDLLKQATQILEGSKQINSDEIRANINLLVKEAKLTLVELDFDKTVKTMREAVSVASKKLREATDEIESQSIKKLPAKPKAIKED